MKVKRPSGVVSPITIYIPVETHERALKLGINMSKSGRSGIEKAVTQAEHKKQSNPRLATDQGCPTA